jgi:SAM-dependent methyltransferase
MPACNICRSERIRHCGNQKGWGIYGCRDCGFHFAAQCDATAEVPHYEESYFDAFIDRDQGSDFLGFYRSILDRLAAISPGRRLLDAGSGTSLFSATAKAMGWDARAIDGSAAAVAFLARRHEIDAVVVDLNQNNSIRPALGSAVQFDAINSFHVIEHLRNPRGYLESCFDVLTPGGVLHLGLPFYPWGRVQWHEMLRGIGLANHPFNFNLPDHVAFFDGKTIRALLNTVGFSVCDFRKTAFWSLHNVLNAASGSGRFRQFAKAAGRLAKPLTSRIGMHNHLQILAIKPRV